MKEQEIALDQIEILSFDEIEEKYKVSKKDIFAVINSKNNAENYWYPYDENGFTEEEVKTSIKLFKSKFEDFEIKSENDYKFTEFFLSTFEKHIFAFSLINHFDDEE